MSGGAIVTLSSNDAVLKTPASVTVTAGSATATFSATSGAITSNQTAIVTATYNGASATASVGLAASVYVSSLSCSPTTLASGASATCTATVSSASESGARISFTSNNALLAVPVSAKLPRGTRSVKFTATAGTIATSQAALVSASLNGFSQSTSLTLSGTQQSSSTQVRLTGLACTTGTLPGGTAGLCSVTLGKVAEDATALVSLSSSNAALQLPATISTRPGQSTVQFQIDSAASAKDETAVISAQLNSDTMQETVSLAPSHDLALAVPASPIVRSGSELRFQVSAADPFAALTAGTLPRGATFDGSTGVFTWTPSTAQQGKYRLTFTAANASGETGTADSAVWVDAGEPVVDRIANGASGSVQGACSTGGIARIEGRWLTQGETASDGSGASTELAGTSVQADGTSVPILYASPTRIDILCPDAVAGLPIQLVVRTPGSVSEPVATTQNAAAPGIFTLDGSGSGQGLVSLAGESKPAMVRNYRYATQPVRPGDRILILATGVGTASNVLVRIGETEVPADSVVSVVGRPGVSQIAAVVPDDAVAGNSVRLGIAVRLPDGSSAASNMVTIAIEEK